MSATAPLGGFTAPGGAINYLAMLGGIDSGSYSESVDPRREVQAALAAKGSTAVAEAVQQQLAEAQLAQTAAVMAQRAPIMENTADNLAQLQAGAVPAIADRPVFVAGPEGTMGTAADMPSYMQNFYGQSAAAMNLQAQLAEQGLYNRLAKSEYDELAAQAEQEREWEYRIAQDQAQRDFEQYMFDQQMAWERELAMMQMSAAGGGGGGGGYGGGGGSIPAVDGAAAQADMAAIQAAWDSEGPGAAFAAINAAENLTPDQKAAAIATVQQGLRDAMLANSSTTPPTPPDWDALAERQYAIQVPGLNPYDPGPVSGPIDPDGQPADVVLVAPPGVLAGEEYGTPPIRPPVAGVYPY